MNYSNLTILQYQAIQSAVSMADNPFRQSCNILYVLTGNSFEHYKPMTYLQFQKECKQIEWLSTTPLPDKYVKTFTVEGETFEIVQYATDWNVEQFISMSTLTKDPAEIINNIHLIMAILTEGCPGRKEDLERYYFEERFNVKLPPSTEKVSLTEFERRATLFQNHLTIDIAYPTAFFFAQFLAKLSQSTQYSLHMEKKKAQARQYQNRMQNQKAII